MSEPLDHIVPVTALAAASGAVQEATESTMPPLNTSPAARDALRYHILFGNQAALERIGLGSLTAVQRFYNQYYWFKRFADEHAATHGPDAGIEQQVFQLLESAPEGVDWDIVEHLERRAVPP